MFLVVKNGENPPELDFELLEEISMHDDDEWNPCHFMIEISDEEAAFFAKSSGTELGKLIVGLVFKAYRQAEEDASVLSITLSGGATLNLLRGGGPGPAPGTFARLMRETGLDTEDPEVLAAEGRPFRR